MPPRRSNPEPEPEPFVGSGGGIALVFFFLVISAVIFWFIGLWTGQWGEGQLLAQAGDSFEEYTKDVLTPDFWPPDWWPLALGALVKPVMMFANNTSGEVNPLHTEPVEGWTASDIGVIVLGFILLVMGIVFLSKKDRYWWVGIIIALVGIGLIIWRFILPAIYGTGFNDDMGEICGTVQLMLYSVFWCLPMAVFVESRKKLRSDQGEENFEPCSVRKKLRFLGSGKTKKPSNKKRPRSRSFFNRNSFRLSRDLEGAGEIAKGAGLVIAFLILALVFIVWIIPSTDAGGMASYMEEHGDYFDSMGVLFGILLGIAIFVTVMIALWGRGSKE